MSTDIKTKTKQALDFYNTESLFLQRVSTTNADVAWSTQLQCLLRQRQMRKKWCLFIKTPMRHQAQSVKKNCPTPLSDPLKI